MKDNDAAQRAVTRDKRRHWRKFARKLSLRLSPWYQAIYDAQMSRVFGGVRVVKHNLRLQRFPPGAPPLRVAFISDLHYGPTVGRLAPLQAWRAVRAANPDLLLLGGDYVYADRRGLPELRRQLKQCHAPLGIYAIWGNHDQNHIEPLREIFAECGVRVLENEAVALPSPWNNIWLAGVDDDGAGDAQPQRALSNVPPGACTIFLAHAPGIYEMFPENECDLTLCGDTHGGQICLPNGTPLIGRGAFCYGYVAGLYRPNGQWLFVSRGVGAVALPLRIFAPPDVAILELS